MPAILLMAGWLGHQGGALVVAQQNAGPEQAKETTAASLHFANGDHVSGHLLDSQSPTTFAWHSDSFRQPLHFAVPVVQSIEFQRQLDLRLAGPSCFELAGAATLLGALVGLDGQEAIIQTPGLGTLHLDRAIVHRFYRTSAADLVFSGPGRLDTWGAATPPKAWRQETGHLRTDQPDATLRSTFQLPPLVR